MELVIAKQERLNRCTNEMQMIPKTPLNVPLLPNKRNFTKLINFVEEARDNLRSAPKRGKTSINKATLYGENKSLHDRRTSPICRRSLNNKRFAKEEFSSGEWEEKEESEREEKNNTGSSSARRKTSVEKMTSSKTIRGSHCRSKSGRCYCSSNKKRNLKRVHFHCESDDDYYKEEDGEEEENKNKRSINKVCFSRESDSDYEEDEEYSLSSSKRRK